MPRALVAEDDAALRRILAKTVSLDGFETDVAEDGLAALELFHSNRYDLLVTDLDMPRMGGLELCAKLRGGASHPGLAVVILTAMGGQDSIQEILLHGADAWLGKPFQRALLLEAIRTTMKRRRDMLSSYVAGDWMEFSTSSALDVLRSASDFVSLLLANTVVNPDDARELGYAVNEILVNAMEHGNGFDASKRVRCSWVAFSDKVVVKIEDQGTGFILGNVPDPIRDPLGVAALRMREGKRPGGYGIALSRKLVDLDYSDNGSVALMTKRFRSPSEGE